MSEFTFQFVKVNQAWNCNEFLSYTVWSTPDIITLILETAGLFTHYELFKKKTKNRDLEIF